MSRAAPPVRTGSKTHGFKPSPFSHRRSALLAAKLRAHNPPPAAAAVPTQELSHVSVATNDTKHPTSDDGSLVNRITFAEMRAVVDAKFHDYLYPAIPGERWEAYLNKARAFVDEKKDAKATEHCLRLLESAANEDTAYGKLEDPEDAISLAQCDILSDSQHLLLLAAVVEMEGALPRHLMRAMRADLHGRIQLPGIDRAYFSK